MKMVDFGLAETSWLLKGTYILTAGYSRFIVGYLPLFEANNDFGLIGGGVEAWTDVAGGAGAGYVTDLFSSYHCILSCDWGY